MGLTRAAGGVLGAGTVAGAGLTAYAAWEARQYTLRFHGVTELELSDLYTQNVLFDVAVDPADDGGWLVTLNPSVGIGGELRCATIEHEPLGRHS